MHLPRIYRLALVLLSGAFLASCGSGPMKGAFSQQLLDDVQRQVTDGQVPQPRAGGAGSIFAPGSETTEIFVFPVGSALLRSEDGVNYAYIFSQPAVQGTALPAVAQTWIFDTDDDLVAPNVALIESIVSDDSIAIAVAGGQSDVALRNDDTGVSQTNIRTDFYRLEAQYSGLAYWIVRSNAYFGSAEYSESDLRIGFYGLATPSSGQPVLGLAAYEGKVFGSYMRNIPADESVAAADRFLVGGDIELLVDFDAGEVSGEASLVAYTTALVLDPESDVVIELADGAIGSDGFFEGSVSVKADGTGGRGVLSGLTSGLSPSGEDVFFRGMFTGPEAQEVVGRADLVGTGYALRFGFVAKEVEVEAEEIPEVILAKIEEDVQSGETEQPTAKSEQRLDEDTNTTVVFPTEEDEAIVRTNGGDTFVLIFEEENDQNEKVVQTWTFNTTDPARAVADNVDEIRDILNTSLAISGSRSEVQRRNSAGVEQTLNVDVYLFEGSYAGFGLWVEKPEEFFGTGSYNPGALPVVSRIYGLATPSADFPSGGSAVYEGKAAGVFVRNYGTGTVAAADRYTLGGDMELEVDFGNSTVGGSAELRAYTTGFAAASPASRVSIGLVNGLIDRSNVSFAGSVAIAASGTGVLSGLIAGLNPAEDGFSGIFAGSEVEEAVGRAEFRTSSLALEFGFAAEQETSNIPLNEIAASVLADVRSKLGDDEAIAQPVAGQSSFDDTAASDYVFPASSSSAIIRSVDGSEYAYAFTSEDSVQAWRFAIGSSALNSDIVKLRTALGLGASGFSVAGSRANVVLGSIVRNIDLYVFEGSYAGLGLLVENHPEEFFGLGNYSLEDSRLELHYYGLASPQLQAGNATYIGKAAGTFVRNIRIDGTATASDRFLISGDVRLQARFGAGSIEGSAELTAHALDISAGSQGELMLSISSSLIRTDGSFAGSVSVAPSTIPTGAFAASFTENTQFDEASGYSGLLAGRTAQEAVGRVQLSASSTNLQFGFLAARENEAAGVTPSVVSSTRADVDEGTTIREQPAGSESFAGETANDLVLPSGGGAVIRSKDGSEYAYVFKEGDSTQAWTFAVSEPGTAAAGKASALRDLAPQEYSVSGGRDPAADGYFFERRYSGLGIWAEGQADEFFGSGSYSSADLLLSIYGLATPSANIPDSIAIYVGRAFGVYLRNIQQDGSAAADDRFVVSGELEIEADFEQDMLGGSVQLVAHRLTGTEEIAGSSASIELAMTSVAGGDFSGNASAQLVTGVFADLNGVSLDSTSGYSGFLTGPAGDELAGTALLLASNGSQRLEFGFIGEYFNIIPIEEAFLGNVEAKVLAGDEIAQPTAGSERLDSLTTAPIVFPASEGAAIVRSRDGFEFAYIFREGDPVATRTWIFSIEGLSEVSQRVSRIRGLVDTEVDVFGSRSEISRLNASGVEETLDADIYVLEIAQAGFGLVVENPEEFFGTGAYSTTGTPLAAVFYGLATPDLVAGTAVYSGSVAGGYMRNIQGDGTVAAEDRFLISGDIELQANFAGGLIAGSAELTAHSLDLTTEHGTVGVGLNATISSGSTEFSGDVEITTTGTVDLIGLSAGLSADSSVFRGLIAGLDADSVAGRAEFRQAGQGLLFGFVATGQSLIPTSPIAASVRNDASTKVDAGEQIATQVAASESFASPTESDLAFRTVDGALIRSRDGSEYAYVFKQDGGNLNAWSFAVGTQSVSANVANIRARLNASSIDVAASRGLVSLGNSVFNADAYIFEASYAGFGLLVQEPERFFSSESDDFPAGRVGVRHYGFESPVVGSVGFAVYEGKAAGGYVRNIKGDGTAAAADRFVLSGDIELTADLGNSTIVGSVDLIAHSLDFSATEQGKVKIGLIGLPTAGDLSIEADGEGVLEGLTAGLSADEGSGLYSSLIAGPTAQQLAGSAEFRAGNQGLLFGFIAFRETSNVPSSPIAAAVLADVNEKVDNRDSIAVPFADSEKFDPNTSTANDVVMQNDKGSADAVIRSKDGSEYAFVFKRFSPTRLLSWRFVSSRPAVGADIAKVSNILDSANIRAIGSQAQVRSRDDVFAVDAFIFEQSYSGAAILINRPEVFFDSSAPYVTSDARSPAFAYGLRPAAEISSGFGNYTGKAFGTYISGITDGVAQGTNRYLVSGDVELAVDFRNEGIQGSINLGAYDLSLNQAVGAAEIEVLDIGVGSFLEELAAPFFYEISSMTGVLSGIDDSRIRDFKFGLFSPQAGEISGFVHAHGTSSQLTFGFVATAPDVKIASSPITDEEVNDAITVSDGHKISQPQADHENFDSLTGSAFFPNNSAELLGRSRDGSEFYYSYLNRFVGVNTDENKLAFSNISVTGECASLTELARGEGNDCTGINNASADEVFAFELSYHSRPQCVVTDALTSKYANGDICSLDDIAIDFAFTMGGTATSTTLIEWLFAPGGETVADNAESIKARLGAPAEGIDVIGTQTISSLFDTRADSIRGLVDAYFFEADYAGFGLFIFRGSDAFFGSGTYNPNRAFRARYYGLQAPSFTSSYTATYEGPAAGAYMRDISGSGTERTVSATDRYIVTGDVELQANFATGEIAGSADLIARDLNISNAKLGEVRIGLTNGSIEDSFFSGDVSIASQGKNAFSALTQGLAADNISGFRGLIAGTGAQEIAGEATFRRNNVHLLHFGFVAPNTATTVPSWVLSTDLIDDTLAKLDADESIEQPVAGSETGLGTDTPSETLVFPIGGGALVRSGDGSEFALIRKTNTFDRTSFTVSPTNLFDGGENDPSCRNVGTLNAANPTCNGFNAGGGGFGLLDFQLVFEVVDGTARIRCNVQHAGNSSLQLGTDRCNIDDHIYADFTENTEEVPQRNVWHFVSNVGRFARINIEDINAILNISDIKVSGSTSSVTRDNAAFDVDAYAFEGEYGGFALLVEERDTFFNGAFRSSIRSVAAHHYGLRTPASAFAAGGYARYEGKAAGGYMRNIALDETVAGTDRFVLSGDFVLDADLTSSTIEGSVDLIAHFISISQVSRGTVKLNLASAEISNGSFAGDIQVAANGTDVLDDLTAGLESDEGSGWYRGLLAGPDAQTLAASAQFIAGDRGLIFGLVSSASLSSFSIPTAPLVQSDLVAVKAKLDAEETIEYPQADGTADFADAPSAEALVFPVDDGALVRSEDGTEYALLPPGTEMRTVGARITQEIPAAFCAGHTLPTEVKAGSAIRVCVNATVPSYAFRIEYANNAVTCTGDGNFDDRDGKPCGENVTGLNITPILGEFAAARIWRFIRSLDPAVEANVANIETILDISDIEVIGARSNVTRNGIDFFNVDAYIFEGTYSAFGLLAEEPEKFFDSAADDYTAQRVGVRHYGLATPASYTAGGYAVYKGKAAGGYMRNIALDGTVAGADRFVLSGDFTIDADLSNNSILGLADLIAHNLAIADTELGTVQLNLDVTEISNGSFTGDLQVEGLGTGVLDGLAGNVIADADSGWYTGLIAGPEGQALAASAEFVAGNQGLLFGLVSSDSQSSYNIPDSPIAQSIVDAASTKFANNEVIAQPVAGSESFDSATATALTFPIGEGAFIRATDGSEYIYAARQVIGIEIAAVLAGGGQACFDGNDVQVGTLSAGQTLANGERCVGLPPNSGDQNFFWLLVVENNRAVCTVERVQPGSTLNEGDDCTHLLDSFVTVSADFSDSLLPWRFTANSPALQADVTRIKAILDSSDIDVTGSRSRISQAGTVLDVDAYVFENSYAGFGIWAEGPFEILDISRTDAWFYGLATPASSLPSAGTATYSGKTFGYYMRDTDTDDAGYRFLTNSDFSATANFADRSINMGFGSAVRAYGLGSSNAIVGTTRLSAYDVSITANSSSITGKVKVADNTTGTGVMVDFTNNDPAAAAEGTISGIIAGPNFEEMAGSVSLEESGDKLKMGFIGSKQ